MATIDLSNYPIIKNNQEGSCQISAMIGLHGIDLAETNKSLLLTTLTSISTTLQVVGQNMLNYTGYAVINDEIVYVNSTVAIGDNLSLSISRGMNGTVAQTLSSINRDYIYPIQLFFPNTYDDSSKTDISDSDLWGFSLDNGKCQIIDNPDNWNYFNSSKLYNKYINKEIFIFEGINGQFIKNYEGVTTRINTDSTNVIEIEFSDNSAKTYNESLDSNKYYNNVTLKELLEDIYPEQRVQYVADTVEANYPLVKYFTLGDFETYSAMLSYICKQFAVRIIFRKNNTIFIFSDVMQENLVAQEEITAFDIVDITDNSSGQLVINDAEGTYIYRKSFVNEDDYDSNNKYVKWNFNKSFTGNYTILNTSIWKEVSFAGMSTTELSYISYDNYVMLKDISTGNEYMGKPSSIDITTGTLKVVFGTDKYSYWDELGRLSHTSSTITLTNPVLYYSPDSKPIIAKFGLKSDDKDITENLKFPIVAGEEYLFYLNFSATTSNDNKFTGISLGNYVTTEDSRFDATNGYADNTYLKFGREYYQNSVDFPIYLYSSKIDTSYNDRIAISTLNNEDVLVKTEWSDDSESNLKVTLKNNITHNTTEYAVLSVNDNVIQVSSTTYSAISAGNCIRLKGMNTSDIGYTTYLNYRYITFCVTSKSTDGTNYYLTLDTKYPDKVMDIYLSFNIINNASKHSITEWVTQSSVKVNLTTFNTLRVGDCLKLAGILSSDTRYDRYLEYKEARFLVTAKENNGGVYYIYLNTDYPRKYGYANFDFVRFPREQVILINEFYIRGNPIMEYTNSYSFDDEESKKLYGSKKYSLDGKNLSQEDFSKIAGYVFKTYAGTNTTNMRTKLEIEIPCRFDLEVGNIINLTDAVATKYNSQKCMIIGKSVSYSESGRTEKLSLLTIGDYSTSANSINISSTSGFSPVVIPTYSHTGGEGTTSQSTNQNISNKTVILYDDTQGTVTLKEVEFYAYINKAGGFTASDLSISIPIDGITANDDYIKSLLRDTAEGVIKVNNEYIAYKCSGGVTSYTATIISEKRGLGGTTLSPIYDNQKVTFYSILSKVSSEGIISNDMIIGNGVDNYVKVSTTTGVDIKSSGNIDITNTTNELFFDKATPSNSFLSMNNGSQQIGRVKSLTGKSDYNGIFVGDKVISNKNYLSYDSSSLDLKTIGNIDISNNSNKNQIHFEPTDGESFISLNNGSQQIGKVNIKRNIPLYSKKNAYSKGELVYLVYEYFVLKANGNIPKNTEFVIGTGDTEWTRIIDYESMWNYQFNGFFSGNKEAKYNQYLYYDATFNFKGSYFNGVAYCSTSEEFIGALCQQEYLPDGTTINPFYRKEINNIILTGTDYYKNEGAFSIDSYNLTNNTITVLGIFDYINENTSFKLQGTGVPFSNLELATIYYFTEITIDYVNSKTTFKLSKKLLGNVESLGVYTTSPFKISRLKSAYDLSSMLFVDTHYCSQQGYLIPHRDIKSITSNSSSLECTIDMGSTGLILNNEIKISNLRFKNIGSNYKYMSKYCAIYMEKTNIIIDNVRFLNLRKSIFGNNGRDCVLKNVTIENYDVDIVNGIEYFILINNLTLVLTKQTNNPIVYESINISGLFIEGADENLTKLFYFIEGAIANCNNINNIWIQNNLYNYLFKGCQEISNVTIIPMYSTGVITDELTYYYFYDCKGITNIVFYASNYPNTKFISNCRNITNTTGLTYKQISNLTYDANNSWNLKKCLVNDTLIDTTTYNWYTSILKPQYLHIHIKENTSSFVTVDTDFNINSSISGSYGLYKFIYNSSLSQWELHQLNQNKKIDGNYINIKFNYVGNTLNLYVKSKVTSRYITIFTDEIK